MGGLCADWSPGHVGPAESHGQLVPSSARGAGCQERVPTPTPTPHVPSGLGQLLVWEWQSESYVLKQQGHFNSMVSLAYSPDGQYIVTGGDDGKVGCGALEVGWSAVRERAWGELRCGVLSLSWGRGPGVGPQLRGSACSPKAHTASPGPVKRHLPTYRVWVGRAQVSP